MSSVIHETVGTISPSLLLSAGSSRTDNHPEVMKHAIITNGIEAVAFNNATTIELRNNFSNEIKSGKITTLFRSNQDDAGCLPGSTYSVSWFQRN